MKFAALFLLAISAHAAIIDCGSPTDTGFVGGTAFTIASPPPGITDATMRFGPSFSYAVNVPATNVPQLVTLRFIEPSVTLPGQRIFSVAINNHPVIDRIDLVAEAGYLRPLARSFVAMPTDGTVALKIVFTTQVRSAVVSAIEVTPLAIGGGAATTDWVDNFTAAEGQTAFITAFRPAGTVRVFLNGLRMRLGSDYAQSIDQAGLVTVQFLPAQPVATGAAVTLEYQR